MSTESSASSPRLLLEGITKVYGNLWANHSVNLRLEAGKIHGLIGENGAGKSTLVKIIYGIVNPDSGNIFWEGNPIEIKNPSHAQRLGIGMVFQHFCLFESLTITENVALGIRNYGSLSNLKKRIFHFSDEYGLAVDPEKPVFNLSAGERQRVEILRCLLQDLRLLIMDEPTSVLTSQETDDLFVILKKLKQEGKTILYISHKLREIKELCSDATILRLGKNVGICDPQIDSSEIIAEKMIGKSLNAVEKKERKTSLSVEPYFEVKNINFSSEDPFRVDIENISFSVNKGEIFGIAGIAGNGQDTLCELLSGEIPLKNKESIMLDGQPIANKNLEIRRKAGLEYVPEDRLGKGTVPEFSLSKNIFLTKMGKPEFCLNGFLNFEKAAEFSERIIEKFDVRFSGKNPKAHHLSGGNLQKWIMGKAVMSQPNIIIISAPTWGVDAGAASYIHQTLIDLSTQEGVSIILISQDLDEIFALSDRVAAICAGKLSQSYAAKELDQRKVGMLMGGISLESSVV